MDTYQKAVGAFTDFASYKIPLPPSKFPRLEKHSLALEGRLILFPFLGELGLEVRSFLGQIEPWLRSGWMIPARRSSLYPTFSAFEDPVFFDRVNEIKKEYGLYEMVGRLALQKIFPINLASGMLDQDFHYNMSAHLENDLIPALMAQKELRSAFWDRYGHDRLVPTKWHLQLSSSSHDGDNLYYCARHATLPSYQPDFFVNPPFNFDPHIGVQLRNVPSNPSRNSDPERMGRLASIASQTLSLPVLVYGRPTDQTLPGLQRTTDLVPPETPQMNAELVFLKSCKLMISPDSGWADLMGWLRVPTLLERLHYPWGFESLRPFRPKILLADDAVNLAERIKALCESDDNAVLLPDPDKAENTTNDFLHPRGKECREFWQEYRGEVQG